MQNNSETQSITKTITGKYEKNTFHKDRMRKYPRQDKPHKSSTPDTAGICKTVIIMVVVVLHTVIVSKRCVSIGAP